MFLRILRIQLPWLFLLRQILKDIEMPQQKPLRPILNAWGNSKLRPFWGKFQKPKNISPFIKEKMVSIMLQLFISLRNYACM